MPVLPIQVALSGMRDAGAAVMTASRALRAAAVPAGLRFALSKRLEKEVWELWASAGLHAPVAFFGEREGFSGAMKSDAGYTLCLMGEYDFQPRWDQEFLRRFGKLSQRGALMTGMIGAAEEPLPPQPYLPGLSERFGAEGTRLVRGLPLVQSAAPPPTLAVNPTLLFARTETFRRMDLRPDTLSFAAYGEGIPVYALDRAALWPLRREEAGVLRRPLPESTPAATAARFEQLAGFRREENGEKRSDLRAQWGLFQQEGAYAQTLPAGLKWEQRGKRLLSSGNKRRQPLLTTCFIDLPRRRKPVQSYLLRFRFLAALRETPLYLYVGGAEERGLRSAFPNARGYPDASLLPRRYLSEGMTKEEWMRRNKIFLLEKTSDQHPDYDYLAWVNIDALKVPVCPEVEPDFSSMMDGRVHLATVEGRPDLSFVLVPRELVRVLRRQTEDLTQLDAELKRGFSEEALWERLYRKTPERFCLHPMPRRRLLFLTGFPSALLDERAKALLERGKQPAAAAGTKERSL